MLKNSVVFCPSARIARKYVMTRDIGIRLILILKSILKQNSAMAYARNVLISFTRVNLGIKVKNDKLEITEGMVGHL